jgi:hypothetical protein
MEEDMSPRRLAKRGTGILLLRALLFGSRGQAAGNDAPAGVVGPGVSAASLVPTASEARYDTRRGGRVTRSRVFKPLRPGFVDGWEGSFGRPQGATWNARYAILDEPIPDPKDVPPIPRDHTPDPRWGLCSRCSHASEIRTRKGTSYLRCRAPGLPRYPRTPVTTCSGFEEARASARRLPETGD